MPCVHTTRRNEKLKLAHENETALQQEEEKVEQRLNYNVHARCPEVDLEFC